MGQRQGGDAPWWRVLVVRIGVAALVASILLAACSPIADEVDEVPPLHPTTQPFQDGGLSPGMLSPAPSSPPASQTCTEAQLLHERCNGETIQFCNGAGQWENLRACGVIGQRCSTVMSECGGFFNDACCVAR